MPAIGGGGGGGSGSNAAVAGASMAAPPAALGRHASKQRKHSSAGPLTSVGAPLAATPNGGSPQSGPGSTGLIVGSARPSRAVSPLQTQTQGGGTAGNPILMPSVTGMPTIPSPMTNSPALGPSQQQQQQQQAQQQQQSQHPYATGAGMQTPAPYARAEYANGGAQSPNGVYGGGVPGGSGMLVQQGQQQQLQQRNSMMGVSGQPGVGSRQANIQQGLPEERSLPAPPKKSGFMDILMCRCG